MDEVEGEASEIWCSDTGHLKPLVKCFISIGTGNPGKAAMKDSLLPFLSKTVVEIATQTEKTEERFIAKWRQHFEEKRYFRFNVDQGLQQISLAEYNEQGIIEAVTDDYLRHQAQKSRVQDCILNLCQKQSVYISILQKSVSAYFTQIKQTLHSPFLLKYRSFYFTIRNMLILRRNIMRIALFNLNVMFLTVSD